MALSAGQNWVQRLAAQLFGIRYMQDGGTLLVDGEGQAREYDTLNAVYPLRAAANQTEGRFDLSIEPTALIPEVPTSNTAYVDSAASASGVVGERTRPFVTIQDAINAVVVLGPATGNRYLIQIQPGIYSEGPLILPSWVTLAGPSGSEIATVLASTATSPLITAQPDSVLRDLTLTGANGVGGIGLLAGGAGVVSIIGCVVAGCETLYRATGADTTLTLRLCSGFGDNSVITGIEALNGAGVSVQNCNFLGVAGNRIAGPGISVDGSGSSVDVALSLVMHADESLRVSNGGRALAAVLVSRYCDIGIRIPASGGTIEIGSSEISNTLSEDIIIDSSLGKLTASGLLHDRPPNIAQGAGVFGSFFDRVNGVVSQEGSLCSGAPDRPGKFAAGQGCATAQGMTAFHYDGLTWTDVTAELTSPSGSEISVVPGTGLGNYLYIGASQPFSALELLVTLAQTGGTLTPEYWKDGVGWTAVDWMLTRDNVAYGNELFATTGLQDKRLGATVDWVATTENGVLAYWYRIGVTSALTTVPRLEQTKLHYNHLRISGQGAVEIFGDEEPLHGIDVDLEKWTTEGGAALPNTVTLSYSSNVSKAVPSYPSASPRGQSYELNYPPDADTSRPLRLILEASSSNTDTATYVMALYQVLVPPGSTLSGGLTGEASELKIVTPTGTANQTQLLEYEILRPEAISGTDRLCLTLRRETNDVNDTHTGAVQISKATMYYSRWKP